MGLRSVSAVCVLAVTASFGLSPLPAQGKSPQPGAAPAQVAVALHPELLPMAFGPYSQVAGSPGRPPEPASSLVEANKAALEECGPLRSQVVQYGDGPKTLQVEATEFKDVSGALAAFSMLDQPGMRELAGVGSRALEGSGEVLLMSGASVVVAYPASAADRSVLAELARHLPIAEGSQALQPLLPSILPIRGLTPGTLRYALGPETYMAGGGVLPAANLGWNQSMEAITARYNDHRGSETLTLLLYPTPTIAGAHLRSVQALLPGLGPHFRDTRTRREGSLVIVANGSFAPDAAQNLVENTHLRQILSTDKAMPTPDVIETRKTFGLFANIILFSLVGAAAAILLGVFLGGGRALVRILQGKPAATETEFLSLHLEPQNPIPAFHSGDPTK